MKWYSKESMLIIIAFFVTVSATCQNTTSSTSTVKHKVENKSKNKKYKLPKIDLSHWSVTTPGVDEKGKALTVAPPQILNYATDERLLPYMYNDSTSGALVFYAYPTEGKTANTKYSRSELREQIVAGNNKENWTFLQGGKMKGSLAIDQVSKDSKGKFHKVIIMQIHGVLSDEQRDLIGQKDNNAPPILKIYWQDGKIRVKTKVLKNWDASPEEILKTESWVDDAGFDFEQKVDFSRFTLEVKVSDGKLVVILNNSEFKVYEDNNMKKWGVFQNYFKAGNYFQSTDSGAYAKVKYYSLEASH